MGLATPEGWSDPRKVIRNSINLNPDAIFLLCDEKIWGMRCVTSGSCLARKVTCTAVLLSQLIRSLSVSVVCFFCNSLIACFCCGSRTCIGFRFDPKKNSGYRTNSSRLRRTVRSHHALLRDS